MRREWMEQAMEAGEYEKETLAAAVDVSPELIGLLLNDATNVTHPRIALRITKILGCGVAEFNSMVHEKHRCEKLPTKIKREVITGETE